MKNMNSDSLDYWDDMASKILLVLVAAGVGLFAASTYIMFVMCK